MRYVLDTNTIIYYIKGRYPALDLKLRHTPAQSVFIPSIVKAEIEFGAVKSRDYRKTIELYNRFFEAFTIVPFDEKMTADYGRTRADLERRGEVIGPNDLIIAATALSMEATLVTRNIAEFRRVEGLQVEDWTI
ncbi:MAG: type II toxin-antitoxin system VapC family toxin [Lachnospiraceae bacterium]|nr:type II toxin-antitoxin system VapC family toxin [Lachnospiraceae bacterium]